MRQNSEVVTRQNLLTELQSTHPANLLSGTWIIQAFTLSEFHGGIDPDGQKENPIFASAAMLWAEIYGGHTANVEDLNDEFDSTLSRYTKLLTAFSAYLSEQGLTEAQKEVTRIQSGLLLPLATAPAKGAGWRESLACAVALAGAVLLGLTCNSKEAWQCFVGMLSLVMVAVPVWKLATWYAQRRALITQPQATR
jgi:hypothetical protein